MPAEVPLWLIIHGLLPLMMVLLVHCGLWLRDQGQSLASVIRNGGLWLYSVTLLAGLLYDLLTSTPALDHPLVIILIMMPMIGASFLYGSSIKTISNEGTKADQRIALASFGFAIITLFSVAVARSYLGSW